MFKIANRFMSKHILYWVFLPMVCIQALKVEHVNAQSSEIDSLRTIISKSPDDSVKVNNLNKLAAKYWHMGFTIEIVDIASEALQLARQIKYDEGLAQSLFLQSAIFVELGRFDEMQVSIRESIRIYKALDKKEKIVTCHGPIVKYYIRIGSYDSAYIINRMMYEFYDSVKNNKAKASTLIRLSQIRAFQANDKAVLRALLMALKIYKDTHDVAGESVVYQELGNFYNGQNDEKISKYYFKKQLEMSKISGGHLDYLSALIGLGNVYLIGKGYDSALIYFNGALKEELKINDLTGLGVVYNNLGETLYGLKRYKEAKTQFLLSVDICKKINDIEGLIYPLQGMSLISIKRNQLKEADSLLKESLYLSHKMAQPKLLAINYDYMSILDSAKGNYLSAFQSYKKSALLNDSLLNEKKSHEILAIQTSFDVEEKENEIASLNQEKRMEAELQEKTKFIYLVIVILGVILILALLYILRSRILLSQLTLKSQAEIMQNNLKLTRVNQELTNVMSQLESRQMELEKKNILLQELNEEKDGLVSVVAHDLRSPIAKTLGLVQILSLSGELNSEQNKIVEMLKKVSKDGNALISDLLDVSSISSDQDMQSETIDLEIFMQEFIAPHRLIAEKKNITITIDSKGSGLKVITYVDYLKRTLDNLVSNAVKFSNPNKTVSIKFCTTDDGFEISVSDLGQGIRPEEIPLLFKKFKTLSARPTAGETSTGLGLSIVKALVEKMKGTIAVKSEFGKGSTFTVTFKNQMSASVNKHG